MDLDDPLGDLLSDGSDDSFFGSKPKANTAQKEVKTTKSKMENLFGIQEPTPQTQTSGPSSIGVIIKPERPAQPRNAVSTEDKPKPAARQIPKKEISFEDDDDIFADLGFDPKKPKAGNKKSNILDDLLGLNEPKATTKPAKPVTPKANVLSRQSTFDKPNDPPEESIGYAPTNRLKTPITKRKSETKISDPLGFFSSSAAPTTKPQTPKHVKKVNATADWLGIDTPSRPESSNVTADALPVVQKPATSTMAPVEQVLQQSNLTQPAQMITSIGNESSLHGLQQHETQLMVAVQMKNQELALIDMQRKQHELLSQQEHNFNELMQKQVQRQAALEQNIQWQQERINSHIQRLMTPTTNSIPVSFQPTSSDQKTDTVVMSENQVITEIELKAEVKQLELDKIRLEDVFHSVKTNHDQEVELLEQSHRKQIQLLEENLVNTEQRLRAETINLEAFYASKVVALTNERAALISSYELKISQLEDNYARILGKLKTHHEEEVDDIRKEHRIMIDNIRQSKLMEFALVQDNSSYLDALKSASGYLETASDDLQTIRVDLETKLERAHKDREIQLEIREKKMNDQQKHFEKLRDATETERVTLLELVKTLEIKLNSVTQSSEEELWSIRQQRATLDTERTAFEREREFARERISREEKRFEDLKAYHQMENERWQQQLQDDRITVLAEKSKLKTLERLQRPSEISTSRAEIDAAVQVAQDAARQSDLERERHIVEQRKFESRRRELIDQENGIRARETELDSTINDAKSKGRVADARFKACTVTEQQLASKLAHLQLQSQELSSRETKLSQEKFELSQERLELQAMRRKMYQSRCSLCKIGDQSKELAELLSKADVTHFQNLPNFQHRKNAEDVDELLDREVTHGMRTMTEYPIVQATQSFDTNEMEADLLLARFEAMNKGFLK